MDVSSSDNKINERLDPSRWSSFLANVSLLKDLSDVPGAIDALCNLLKEKKFNAGHNILSEGEVGEEMYFLISGKAKVLKLTSAGEYYTVAVLKDENYPFFGEGALLEEDSRGATIQAMTECHCLVLEQDRFEKFCQDYPQWAIPIIRRVARVIMSRLRKANEDFVLLYNALVNEVRGE